MSLFKRSEAEKFKCRWGIVFKQLRDRLVCPEEFAKLKKEYMFQKLNLDSSKFSNDDFVALLDVDADCVFTDVICSSSYRVHQRSIKIKV